MIFHRRNLLSLKQQEVFLGNGDPARPIGPVVFDLRCPPFKRKTTDKGYVTLEQCARILYMAPSAETICYLVAPTLDAIEGAREEHEAEQDVGAAAHWANLLRALGKL